jgi:TrmH family RNA methyltransferase
VGSEGRGLSRELLDRCDGELIIPMSPGSESLNAAVAASIVLWEMAR